jgi:hypothetical protein
VQKCVQKTLFAKQMYLGTVGGALETTVESQLSAVSATVSEGDF